MKLSPSTPAVDEPRAHHLARVAQRDRSDRGPAARATPRAPRRAPPSTPRPGPVPAPAGRAGCSTCGLCCRTRPLRVDHQHAVLHVLDHELVDPQLVGEVARRAGARARSFAITRCASQLVTHGGGEVADREQPGLHERRRGRVVRQAPTTVCSSSIAIDARAPRKKSSSAPRLDQRRRGERDRAACTPRPLRNAAARVHQQR